MPIRPPVASRIVLAVAALASLAAGGPAGASPPRPPTVAISSVTVVEGTGGQVVFEASVSLSVFGGQSPGPYEVEIVAYPGSADSDDFVFAPARLTLAQGITQTVSGFAKGDAIFEGNETFTLGARALGGTYFLASQPGTVTIVDDDSAGAQRLTIDAQTTVPEGGAGWHSVNVAVRLSAPVTNVVTFDFETRGGRAAGQMGDVAYGDYRATFGTQKLAPGETVVNIPVEFLGDTMWESDWGFEVRIFNARGALLGAPSVGTVTIANDDAPSTTEPMVPGVGMSGPDADIPPGPTVGGPATVDPLPGRGGCAVASGAPGMSALGLLLVLLAFARPRFRPAR